MKNTRGLSIMLLALGIAAGCGGTTMTTMSSESACDDGIDNDDNGLTDCDDAACETDPVCQAPPMELCTGGVDEDGDTFIDCDDDDCWEDPQCYTHDDPTDLPGPDGDPSADLDKIRVQLVNGTATFTATTDGTWPPPAGTYSWFIQFEIDNDGFSVLASAVIQQHDGVDSVIPSGVPASNITVRQTPVGIWVQITGVPSGGQNFYVESGIQKTNPGTRVTDVLGSTPQPLP